MRPPGLRAPVPEAGIPAPNPPPTPAAPAATVPEAPVSPPPAHPNPLGHLLSLVDVEARVTGIALPWTPEAPRTGIGPLDQDRTEEVPDRPGQRAWDASREWAKALWSEGRRQGHEAWNEARGD